MTNRQTIRAALYSRVSTSDQRQDLQRLELEQLVNARGWLVALEEHDEASGASRNRPGLAGVMAAARARRVDVVVVWSLDRLARSVAHAVELVGELEALGVDLVTIRGELDTTTPRGRFMFHVCAAFAELERELARERTMSGLEAARARGVTLGRPARSVDGETIRQLRREGHTWRAVAEHLGVPLSTVFDHAPRSENGASTTPKKQRKST